MRNVSSLLSIIILGVSVSSFTAGAAVLYVAPNGADGAAGTQAQPLSLRAALERSLGDMAITEIILAGGTYRGTYQAGNPKNVDKAKIPPLIIRAANGATPVFDGSVLMDKAKPVDGKPGLYQSTDLPPSAPHMWEDDTRVRYITLSNRDSVRAIPASCFVDRKEGVLYFQTSDGLPPSSHEVRLCKQGRSSTGFGVRRPKVRLQGLHFRGYVGAQISAIQTWGANIQVRDCRFYNCTRALALSASTVDNLVENCTGLEVGNPVYSDGKGAVVRGCRFEKTRGRFLHADSTHDYGYHVYYPGEGATFEYNFAKGYRYGIFIKAKGDGYVVRHNTFIDCKRGISWAQAFDNTDCSYNIIAGAHEFLQASRFRERFTADYNLYWDPVDPATFHRRSALLRGVGWDKHSLQADPRFVDPANGDYRLLPDSPALALKDADGKPAGAFGSAPVTAAAKAKPTLELVFEADTTAVGRTGTYTFDRDPWIGGGTTHIRDLTDESGIPTRVTGKRTAMVRLQAFNTVGTVDTMRITIGDQAAGEAPYEWRYEVQLPDNDGEYPISVQVRNDRGNWSETADAILRLDRHPPKVVGTPIVLANDNGIIVTFRTDGPCFAEIEYGATKALGNRVAAPPVVERKWSACDGGDWVETWKIARTEFALPILRPNVAQGATVTLRIVLTDEAGLKTEGELFTAAVKGDVRTLHVSTTGQDSVERGSHETPLRTPQYALDHALPGDRVLLLPGVYPGRTYVTHGGVDEKTPITMEAAKPGTVTLDSAKREKAIIHLEQAPFVTIRNLRILYFTSAGVLAYRSPNTTIENCVFYNGEGWMSGNHTFCFWSPRSTVKGCLAVGAAAGFYFLESPQARVLNNTAAQQMFSAAAYMFSAAGTIQMNNSFCYAGNDCYVIESHHPDELKTFTSDYNNIGTLVGTYNKAYEQSKPEVWKQIQAETFKPPSYPFRFAPHSKAVVGCTGQRYRTIKAWREFSGQEKHSIFADPMYVEPRRSLIDQWDWRVAADSPNVGAGKNGVTIGARGVAESPSP